MYVINRNGVKLPVDDSKIDYDNSFNPVIQQVTLLDDCVKLIDVWVATCYTDKNKLNSIASMDLEWVAEKKFYHEPTKEELIHLMASNGLTMYDVVNVDKMHMLGQDD